MNEDQLNDLKQFISVTVSQATAGMATKEDIDNLRLEVQDGFAGVSEAIEQVNEQHTELDLRLTKLEQQAA